MFVYLPYRDSFVFLYTMRTLNPPLFTKTQRKLGRLEYELYMKLRLVSTIFGKSHISLMQYEMACRCIELQHMTDSQDNAESR